ncbi:MAG: tetratricopeptide repeat protein [Gemmataceae bacterium]|nr:tetratricopeptide repeat protein [Gemmataceae bacterium]MCI0742023.1 tetratricopeptide repeat protein [Gemmataceae bacterium]
MASDKLVGNFGLLLRFWLSIAEAEIHDSIGVFRRWYEPDLGVRIGPILVVILAEGGPKSKGPNLAELQRAYAMDHFDPQPHMALAKFHHDRGNRLLAYYILETARRTRFEAKSFDAAFDTTFRSVKPFDNSKGAEKALLAKHQQDPKDAETLFGLADIYISREDWPNAKNYLNKLIAVKPEAHENYEALAEVYRQEKDKKKAEEVVEGFFTKYPESVEAYARRIAPLMRKEPDKAKPLLEQALNKHPKHAMFVFNMAVLLQDAGKLKEAEEMFVRAADLGKDSAHIQGWVGQFFLRARENEEKSLQYYLNVYFIDPHFYDTEHAEGRIRKLNLTLAVSIVEKAEKESKQLDALLKHENPVVASLALGKIGQSWNAKAREHVLDALGHDDPTIRMQAVGILMKNPDDILNKDVQALLGGDDLRKRGLACYLAVNLWKEKGIEAVRPMLQDKSQLVRHDAISALWRDGGKQGKQIVRDHSKREKNPWLLRMTESLDKKTP